MLLRLKFVVTVRGSYRKSTAAEETRYASNHVALDADIMYVCSRVLAVLILESCIDDAQQVACNTARSIRERRPNHCPVMRALLAKS